MRRPARRLRVLFSRAANVISTSSWPSVTLPIDSTSWKADVSTWAEPDIFICALHSTARKTRVEHRFVSNVFSSSRSTSSKRFHRCAQCGGNLASHMRAHALTVTLIAFACGGGRQVPERAPQAASDTRTEPGRFALTLPDRIEVHAGETALITLV